MEPSITRWSCLCLLAATGLVGAQDKVLRPPGVTTEIQATIDKGLDFLVRTQNRDGSWRNAGGYGMYPVAMTALAGMALLGSGSTPTRGQQWQAIRRATDFVIKHAQPSGLIAAPEEEGRSMYGHGFGTMFLAQVYGMEEDVQRQQAIHDALGKAVKLTAKSQSHAGGWLYTPDSGGDEGSVTITQVQALRACRNAGITVPSTTIDRAVDYIRKSANADGSINYRVGMVGGRPPITAAAVAVLYNAGKYDDPIAEKALKYAVRTLPINGGNNGHNYYSQLYLAQALYFQGGEQWDDYYVKMHAWLAKQQSADGSWNGDNVGTTYGTAIALTILQLPHGLVPIYQR